MIQISKAILNENLALVGVEVKDENTSKLVGIDALVKAGFKNEQVDCTSGKLVRVNGFKFNQLPLAIIESGKLRDLSEKESTIKLYSQLVKGNDVLGYVVRVLGKEMKLKTKDVAILSELFKPHDYKVVSRYTVEQKLDKSGRVVPVQVRKPFVVGVHGLKLANLPVVNVGKKKKDGEPTTVSEFDTLKLVDYKANNLGALFNRSDVFLVLANDTDKELVGNTKLHGSELGTSISINFKKPIAVNIKGKRFDTFVYRKRKLNDKQKVALGKSVLLAEHSLCSTAFNDIDLGKYAKPISQKLIDEVKRLHGVDTTNKYLELSVDFNGLNVTDLNLLSIKNTGSDLVDVMLNAHASLTSDKISQKCLAYLAPLNKIELGSDMSDRFKGLSEEELKSLSSVGINLSDGSLKEQVAYDSTVDNEAIQIKIVTSGLDATRLGKAPELLAKYKDMMNPEIASFSANGIEPSMESKVVGMNASLKGSIEQNKLTETLCKIYNLSKNEFNGFTCNNLDNWKEEKTKAKGDVHKYSDNQGNSIMFKNIDFKK
jgi:hypothetical protein